MCQLCMAMTCSSARAKKPLERLINLLGEGGGMVKITVRNWRWWHWPLTEEQFISMQKPANILLRLKLTSILFFALAAFFYFSLHRADLAIAIFVGGLAGIVYGIYYYKAVKSGRITYEK